MGWGRWDKRLDVALEDGRRRRVAVCWSADSSQPLLDTGTYTDVGDEGIELGERDPRRGSAARRCCDVRRPSVRVVPGDNAPLDVMCLRSIGGSAVETLSRPSSDSDETTHFGSPSSWLVARRKFSSRTEIQGHTHLIT